MADYKYDTLATESIEWTAGNGAALKITVDLVQESSDYFGSGDYKPTRNGLRINTKTFIGGKLDSDGDWIKAVKQGDVVGAIGRIGLRQDKLDALNALYAKIKSHPAYVALTAAREKSEQAERAYDAHVERVENMMTLGGRST